MVLSSIPTFFSGNPLDRADQLRTHPEILGELAQSGTARTMVLIEGHILSDADGGIVWLKNSQCKYLPTTIKIFLGLDGGAHRYAATLGGALEEFEGMFPDAKFRDARNIAMKMGHASPMLGIIAQAKSMLSWHNSHQFCSNCGKESALVKAGYERRCASCETSHFPRTDPVVIMLAYHGNKALVGRGPHLPPGFFSALAGFMEPGETIEEAVARELMEEVGVTATSVQIVANQPWPWPSSLMIGCIAAVEDTKLTLDEKEIDDARWVTHAELVEALAGTAPDFMMPPPVAIAHDLIQYWLEHGK